MALPKTQQSREYENFKETSTGDVARRVCADATDPVAVTIVSGTGGLGVYLDDQRTPVLGTQTTISNAVPAGKTHSLTQVRVTCRQPIEYRVKIDATVIGSGRTGAGDYNSSFTWSPNRPATAGQTVSVEIDAKQPLSDVETYVQMIET